jgi:hypothetical protein
VNNSWLLGDESHEDGRVVVVGLEQSREGEAGVEDCVEEIGEGRWLIPTRDLMPSGLNEVWLQPASR